MKPVRCNQFMCNIYEKNRLVLFLNTLYAISNLLQSSFLPLHINLLYPFAIVLLVLPLFLGLFFVAYVTAWFLVLSVWRLSIHSSIILFMIMQIIEATCTSSFSFVFTSFFEYKVEMYLNMIFLWVFNTFWYLFLLSSVFLFLHV